MPNNDNWQEKLANSARWKEIQENMEKLSFTVPSIPTFSLPDYEPIRNPMLADLVYERIAEEIDAFQSKLKDTEQVGMLMTNFGQSILMTVTDIGYANPNLLYFYGYIGEQESTLIQHISQLSFLLTVVPVPEDREPIRIGFRLEDTDE